MIQNDIEKIIITEEQIRDLLLPETERRGEGIPA